MDRRKGRALGLNCVLASELGEEEEAWTVL